MQEQCLWKPSAQRIANANITAFMKQVNDRHSLSLREYRQLWQWSVDNLEDFWSAVWDFGGVIADRRGEHVLVDKDKMPGARFFPDAKLNFAENLLRRRDDTVAIVFWGENKVR